MREKEREREKKKARDKLVTESILNLRHQVCGKPRYILVGIFGKPRYILVGIFGKPRLPDET